jgi:hypothetical protein
MMISIEKASADKNASQNPQKVNTESLGKFPSFECINWPDKWCYRWRPENLSVHRLWLRWGRFSQIQRADAIDVCKERLNAGDN